MDCTDNILNIQKKEFSVKEYNEICNLFTKTKKPIDFSEYSKFTEHYYSSQNKLTKSIYFTELFGEIHVIYRNKNNLLIFK